MTCCTWHTKFMWKLLFLFVYLFNEIVNWEAYLSHQLGCICVIHAWQHGTQATVLWVLFKFLQSRTGIFSKTARTNLQLNNLCHCVCVVCVEFKCEQWLFGLLTCVKKNQSPSRPSIGLLESNSKRLCWNKLNSHYCHMLHKP